jgi:dipeptidyl aminopeptidase/acylaminoacyl peptidase
MSKNYILKTEDQETIRITTYGEDKKESKKCIIVVHGFKGFKDWGFFPYVGNYLSEEGYFVITFNYSLNGVGESLTEFDELDKFAQNTFTREIEELELIIDSYRNGFFGEMDNDRIGLLGHSRGGADALLTAYRKQEIDAVAVWASIAKLDRYSERQKKEWRDNGYWEIENARTKQIMRLNIELLQDIEENSSKHLNMKGALKNLKRPLLIAHGEQDLAVPVKEAEQLYEWSDEELTEIFKLSSTGHTFGVQHPFQGTNDKFNKLLDKTTKFFKNNL